jgi:hypothetical protein
MPFEQQLGREVAGNAAPGSPTRPADTLLSKSIRFDFGGTKAHAHRLPTSGDKAAVDDELGAGDERGFVGGEEQTP